MMLSECINLLNLYPFEKGIAFRRGEERRRDCERIPSRSSRHIRGSLEEQLKRQLKRSDSAADTDTHTPLILLDPDLPPLHHEHASLCCALVGHGAVRESVSRAVSEVAARVRHPQGLALHLWR